MFYCIEHVVTRCLWKVLYKCILLLTNFTTKSRGKLYENQFYIKILFWDFLTVKPRCAQLLDLMADLLFMTVLW